MRALAVPARASYHQQRGLGRSWADGEHHRYHTRDLTRHRPAAADTLEPGDRERLQADIDAIEWLAIKVHHGMGEGCFTTRVEMENASADASVAAIKEKN